MQEHPFERLMMDLLEKEDSFEQALTVEHVEDKLINKQIVVFDEQYVMNASRGNLTPNAMPTSIRNMVLNHDEGHFASKFMDRTYRLLADMSHLNRQRRNFRLMRGWIHRRPWQVSSHSPVNFGVQQ
jgi:hypothetical protein